MDKHHTVIAALGCVCPDRHAFVRCRHSNTVTCCRWQLMAMALPEPKTKFCVHCCCMLLLAHVRSKGCSGHKCVPACALPVSKTKQLPASHGSLCRASAAEASPVLAAS